MNKRILILAGSHFQIPVIKYAKSQGHYVITCDNRPLNPGHNLSDKYYNISTTDLDGILEVSKREKIDGVLAYGSDIAAPAAAYVSENLGLPGNSFDTILKLTDKGIFRKFLFDKNFPVPEFRVFNNPEDAKKFYNSSDYTVFVKPVDSSGSKGVTRLNPGGVIQDAYKNALEFSHKKEVIVEKEIKIKGPHIHGEAFIYKGELKFLLLGDQYFSDVNPCAPLSTTLPGMHHRDIMVDIKSNLLTLLTEVKFNTGGLNIEIIIDSNAKIYFVEVGPRSGGNLMPELAQLASGFDLAAANVNAVVDEPVNFNFSEPEGTFCTQVILHSKKAGRFLKPNIPDEFLKYEEYKLVYFSEGDLVNMYRGSHDVIGVILYKFDNPDNCRKLISFIRNSNLVTLD